jgi:hypothetical protein
MDERLHWILSLSAIGLWVIAVWALYFVVLRKHMKDIDSIEPEKLTAVFKTRRQRQLDLGGSKKSK